MSNTWVPALKPPHPSTIPEISELAQRIIHALTLEAEEEEREMTRLYGMKPYDKNPDMKASDRSTNKESVNVFNYEPENNTPGKDCESEMKDDDINELFNYTGSFLSSLESLTPALFQNGDVNNVKNNTGNDLNNSTCKPKLFVFREKKKTDSYSRNEKRVTFDEFATMPSNRSLEDVMYRTLLTTSLTSTTTESISPVTLSSDWSSVGKLLLLTTLSVTGNVGNVFMISAIMIEDHLKKRGNSFLVNIALADILITGLVIPASTVVILAGLPDSNLSVCNFQWFLALVSCLVSVLTMSATAVENYARLCLSPECYNTLTPCKITVIIILIWIVIVTAVSIQTAFGLGPDYCKRSNQGLLPYQIAIGTIFVFVPAALTCVCYSLIIFRVRTYKSVPSFRLPVTFTIDYELMKTNLYGFIFFVIFWLPFGITLAVSSIQSISHRLFYNLAWFALSKSCFSNFIYCITNRPFRNAYVNLFHYCCCKTTVSFSRRTREPVRPTGDVRVHIIPGYNMYSYTSPQRSRESSKSSCKRLGTSGSCRPTTSRPNGRDVYEL